ncbi:uncharacterized protein V6R79_002044 [Siganus canaliculatus]
MLHMLGRRCEKDQTKYGLVTLILDAMAIKRHIQYNPQTQAMSGFVDMGDRCSETDVASEALFFMVVGLQGHWKAPVAYYLTSALSPETLKLLVVHALKELHAHGLRVMCMTMDGHASNISMCNLLGCNLRGNPREPLKTSFAHPATGERVFVMMDACHMLKLARNMLQVLQVSIWYAAGGWNNNPSAGQFQDIFRRLMVRCGVTPSGLSNVAAQDDTVSLSAVEMSSAETAPPFLSFAAIVADHSYASCGQCTCLHCRLCCSAASEKPLL